MKKQITDISKGFGHRWELLSLNQKIMLGTVALALVFSTFFVFQHSNDDYDVLYSNMSLPDAAAAVAKLKELHTPYRIADDGHTLLVPRAKKNEMVLATANELTGEDTVNLAKIPPVIQGDIQKEWIKKLNTQEIAAVLKSIQGVKDAQVIVTQPEDSVFSDNQRPVTASVMLMMEPGYRLKDEQVKVIRNLVAHAVPGLTPENVALADNSGNPLDGMAANIRGGQSDAELAQKNFEEKTAKKVQSILAPVVGKENAVVSVSATLNFDQTETDIRRVIPSGGSADNPTGLAVSQQVDNEEYSGGAKPAGGEGGAVGVDANASPSYPSGGDKGKKDSNYKHTKSTTNFTNSEEHKKVIYAQGNIERMTVAVVLNKVLSAKETDEIRQLVENAAGIDQSRGDSVDIKGFQFSSPPKDKDKEMADAAQASQQQAFYLQLASVGAVVLLGLAALFIFYSLFRRPVTGELVAEAHDAYDSPYAAMPANAGEYAQMPAAHTMAMIENTPIPLLEAKLDPEIEHMRQSINGLVADDPQEAARVLLAYMKDV